MTVNDITSFGGNFVNPEDGRRYNYDASFNAHPPVAWKADLHDGEGWTCRLAGALLEEGLSGPKLRAAITAAIAAEIRATLLSRGQAEVLPSSALQN